MLISSQNNSVRILKVGRSNFLLLLSFPTPTMLLGQDFVFPESERDREMDRQTETQRENPAILGKSSGPSVHVKPYRASVIIKQGISDFPTAMQICSTG